MRQLTYTCLFIAICILASCSQEKETDWSVSMDRNGKEPYGCQIAYQHLNELFPYADIKRGGNIMSYVKSINRKTNNKGGHLIFLISSNFWIDSAGMAAFNEFVENGNVIVLFSEKMSAPLTEYFQLKPMNVSHITNNAHTDSGIVQQISIQYNNELHDFRFRGNPIRPFHFASDSVQHDTSLHAILGYTDIGDSPHILVRHSGNGAFILGSSAIPFTNYFLLQGENRRYYEYLLSWINEDIESIRWYSKALLLANQEEGNSWLKFPPLFYAFVSILLLFLLYAYFEGKRRQRAIEPWPEKKNASLEFVETIGRLYFNKGDHKNLAEKMIRIFQDFLRQHYQLKPNEWNDDLALQIARKSDLPLHECKECISFIDYICHTSQIEEGDIKSLYFFLKKFKH